MVHRLLLAPVFMLLALCGCHDSDPPEPPPLPPVLSSEKAITSFVFKAADNSAVLVTDATGTIGPDIITVTLNKGISISSLKPSITHTGVSITPNSIAAQDFNNTISYTVKAEDGSTKTYTIKIVLLTANQKLYIGSDDGNLYALNAHNGTLLWKYTTGGAILSSPALVNNTIYVGSMDKYLYAIDAATGALKWKFLTATGIGSESPVVSNGTVLITCSGTYPDGHIYAVDAVSGTLKWAKNLPGPSTPVASGGKVFLTGIEGHLNAYNITDGSLAWGRTFPFARGNAAVSGSKLYLNGSVPERLLCVDAATGNTIWSVSCLSGSSGPTVSNGLVYISCGSTIPQYSEAFDAANGNLKWKYSPEHSGSSPNPTPYYPIALDTLVYPGLHYGKFYAQNAVTGTVRWEFGSGIFWFANPVAANRVVYAGAFDKNVYALEAATGKLLWKFLTAGTVHSGACVIDSDGTIIHAGASGMAN